jgi:hypothetical protein
MGRRRRGDEAPVSFFSFQDVMMCTIGVTIVITMVLVLQLGAAAAKVATAAPAQGAVPDRMPLETEARALRQRLESAAARAGGDTDRDRAQLRQEVLRENERAQRLERRAREAMERLRMASARASADPAAVEAADLLQRREELEDRLRTESLRRRVTYLLAPEDRTPVIVEVSGDRLVAGTTLERDAPLALPLVDAGSAAELLSAWMAALPQGDRRSVLFVVKPSGVAAWRAVRERLLALPGMADVPTGLDLIPEDAFTSDRFRGGDQP